MKVEYLKFNPHRGGKSFIGLKYKGNTVEIHYPESFHWKNNELINNDGTANAGSEDIYSLFSDDIRLLLRTINLAKSLSDAKEKAADILSSEEDLAIISYMWIIKDYMANGIYRNREPADKINTSGRINWKKTMNRQPIVSGGNIIYHDIVASVKSNADGIITEIYRYCICKSVYLIGWLYGINDISDDIDYDFQIELSEELKQKYNYYLDAELNKTFDDIKRERLKHMRNIINGLNKSENGTLVYGVKGYHYIFERMIDCIFGTEKAENYHPKGIWHPQSGGKHDSSSLEPDTILIKDDICVIIDSKCYPYFFEGYADNSFEGLPSTSSIQKQITYGDHIFHLAENKVDKNKIYNCFILPFDRHSGDTENNNIKYVMYADTNWKEASLSYDEILVFFVDMRYVIESWDRQNHNEDIDELISLIIENRDKIAKEKIEAKKQNSSAI